MDYAVPAYQITGAGHRDTGREQKSFVKRPIREGRATVFSEPRA
jgi:hypothetical protein